MLLYCQVQDPKSFFPHQVGDTWHFAYYEPKGGIRDTSMKQVVISSDLSNGWIYIRFKERYDFTSYRDYLIDTLNQVYTIEYQDTVKMFDLVAPMGSYWRTKYNYKIQIDTIYESTVFGKPTTIRVFSFWKGDSIVNGMQVRFFVAKGFGVIRHDGYEAYYNTTYLIGALINNVQYGVPVSVNDDASLLSRSLTFTQNYPNPFKSETFINFSIFNRTHLTLNIYDVLGKLIRKLFNNEFESGNHLIRWDGLDDDSRPLPSGLYFYHLTAEKISIFKAVTLVR